MRLPSTKILFFILCCFAFNVSAGSLMLCCDLSEDMDMQSSSESSEEKCHVEKDVPAKDTSVNCCLDMSLCNAQILFTPSLLQIETALSHQLPQLSSIEHIILKSNSPPTPPPKKTS
jgi:hypothetical protein